MNLTQEQAKKIIIKANKDLNLYHSAKYPVLAHFISKNSPSNSYGIDYWAGGYDYSDPKAVGDEINYGEFPEYSFVVHDAKGEAVKYGYYTGHYYLELKNGKYSVLGNWRDTKRPW
ncbi:MAG: hypothetical protein ACJA1C_002216 [Crocinitomicaceae bacterium]|jgi:hypothetical protein